MTLPQDDINFLLINESMNLSMVFTGDPYTRLLWTADDRRINFAVEMQPWDSGRGTRARTNICQQAYAVGKAFRTGLNRLTITAVSRAFGFNRDLPEALLAEASTRYDAAVQFLWE
jgi:hypothetical protein